NVSVAAICKGDWKVLGEMMKKDHFHQPYRKSLIPHYDELYDYVIQDAYGVFLSGAGPTMLAIVEEEKASETVTKWQAQYPSFQLLPLSVENNGSMVNVF